MRIERFVRNESVEIHFGSVPVLSRFGAGCYDGPMNGFHFSGRPKFTICTDRAESLSSPTPVSSQPHRLRAHDGVSRARFIEKARQSKSHLPTIFNFMHFFPRIIILVLVLNAVAARGETITVFSGGDGGPGTLRQAIFDASSGDTINFASGLHEIRLSSDELLINKNLTIEGPGAGNLAVERLAASSGLRVFHIAPTSVTATISGLTIKSAPTPSPTPARISGLTIRLGGIPNFGGGIWNEGTLTMDNCAISDNSSTSNGGGIANDGTLTMDNCTISDNSSGANGGGVANTGMLTITNSTISGNTASSKQSSGGGIANTGMLTVTNSTISGNQSNHGTFLSGQSSGGGIANFDSGTLTITNSTVSGNQSVGGQQSSYGGGIANSDAAMLTITNSTISGNGSSTQSVGGHSSGGGIANFNSATLTITNSTVAGNTTIVSGNFANCGGGIFTEDGSTTTAGSTIIARNNGPNGPDLCGPVISQNYNLVGNNADATITPPQPSDLIGTPGAPIDPLIGPLQYNGGPTFTRALQSNSPAVNHGDSAAPATDQRGYYRAGVADIGAFEFGGTVPVSLGNLSTRGRVETGNDALIGGFIITGLYPKKIMVRAIGPSLPLPAGTPFPTSPSVTRTTTGTESVAEVQRILIPPAVGGTYRLIFYNPYLSGGAPMGSLPQRAGLHASVTIGWNYSVDQIRDAVLAANTWWAFTKTGWVLDYNLPFSYFGTGSFREPVVTGTEGGYDFQFGTPISSQNTWVYGLNLIVIDDSNLQYGTGGPPNSVLADPTLELRDSSGGLIASNDNWKIRPDGSSQQAEIEATGIPPTNDLESAIVTTLPADNSAYTAIVRGVNNGTGLGVVEVYDLNRTVDSTLGNISTRGLVQTGDNVLIAGIIVAGQMSQKVIIRAIGPSLTLAGKLADPMLELHDANGAIVASNDNWRTNQEAEIIATNLAPANDLESAIVWTLAPGSSYTAIVRGVNDTAGLAVVEVYTIQ